MVIRRRAGRPGRRPKGPGRPREDILRAAQWEFGHVGFDRGSIRAVAHRAGVNPALVYHYFESKDRLFRESVRHMMRPPPIDLSQLDRERDVGTAIVEVFLDRWSGGSDSMAFRGVLRSASTSERAASILRELIAKQVTPYATLATRGPDSERRVALVASALMGAGLGRFVLQLPGLTTPSIQQLAAWIGPSVTRYLKESL